MANEVITRIRLIESELKTLTGKSLDKWITLTNRRGPSGEKARKAWLRAEHGLHPDHAWLIASTSSGAADYRDQDSLVERMFSGKRASLRPIFDSLMKHGMKMGKDMSVSYCRTQVALKRKHNIVVIRPASNTRIDLGLALGKLARPPRRLIDTGGYEKKDRVTYKIELTSPGEIDAEALSWMKRAYELDV